MSTVRGHLPGRAIAFGYGATATQRRIGGDAYRLLKDRYDPTRALGELFDKCVRER